MLSHSDFIVLDGFFRNLQAKKPLLFGWHEDARTEPEMLREVKVSKKTIRNVQQLTSSEWKDLQLFHETALKLRHKKFLAEGTNLSIQAKFDQTNGLRFSLKKGPDEEIFESFLPTLRKFCGKKEPTFLPRILNLLYQKVSDDGFRVYVQYLRNSYKAATQQHGQFKITIAENVYSPSKFFNLWINGEVFHSDASKREEITKLRKTLGDGLYGFVVDAAIEVTRVVVKTDALIYKAFLDEIEK